MTTWIWQLPHVRKMTQQPYKKPRKTFPTENISEEELLSFLAGEKTHKKHDHMAFKIVVWNTTVKLSHRIKRLIDVVASFLLLMVLSPLLILVIIWLKLDSEGPIIYRQTRVGLNGRHFNFYKFRSMYVDADERRKALLAKNESADGVIFKMKNDPRITRCGRWIRRFSIDELPQILNVLVGDMSLVGPRPPLPSEVALYSLEDRKRLQVIPGLTCLWQISGRSDIPFQKQVLLDKQYIRSRSLWTDFVILLKTIPAVLTGKGAY